MPDNPQPPALPPGPWTYHPDPDGEDYGELHDAAGADIALCVDPAVADLSIRAEREADPTPIDEQSVAWLKAKGFDVEQHQPRWQKFMVSVLIPTTGISRSSIWVSCDIDGYVTVAKRGNLGETSYLAEGKDVTQGWLENLCRLLGITLTPETPAL